MDAAYGNRPTQSEDPEWQSNVNGRLAPGATGRTDRPLGRRKPCPYCRDKVDRVDYKDVSALRRFISERGKIRSRRITGACRRHQSQVARAVKRARELALLPYVAEGANERWERGERSGRGSRRDR